MAKVAKKKEALSVSRLINEVLVAQLSIPFRQIVNDTTFSKYTGSKRPDLLISEFEYDGTNDDQYIKNLVAYAEAKDDCKVDDKDWKDALKQGKIKAPKLGLPYLMSVQKLNQNNFHNAIANGTALVDFYADWCGPCRMVSPIVDEIAAERSDITVGKVNVDDENALAMKYGVMSIPTLIVFKDGQEKTRIVGARPKAAILAELV